MDLHQLSDALMYDPNTQMWHSASAAQVAYPEGDHETCFALEDDSFWFRHRNRCIIAAVEKYAPQGFVLDVGGGNGYVARGLIDHGFPSVLLEPGADGARNARRTRGILDVICASLEDAAIRTGTVPAVGMFDVLEHIEDDHAAIQHIHRVLQPGGYLFLTVPAFSWLWSGSDVAALHYRRYSPSTLAAVVDECFDVLYMTGLFERLVPAFFMTRTVPYALGVQCFRSPRQFEAEHRAGGAWTAALVERVLAHEVDCVSQGRTLRWGSTLLLVARRR